MAQNLAYKLIDGDVPNSYSIRLTDEKQIAALTMSEGFKKPFELKPIPVVYDPGNGELILADGFDPMTAKGRIAMRVLNSVYCDAINQIMRNGTRRSGESRNLLFGFSRESAMQRNPEA